MPRAGVDTAKVIEMAAQMTDKEGINAISLKEIGKQLNVSSPALYNHIGSLAELKKEVSHYAMDKLKSAIVKSSMGLSGMDALKAMGNAYVRFAWEHPGLYETIQWMNIMEDEKSNSLFLEVVQNIYKICGSLGADELEASHLIRTARSIIHGFASIESHKGFGHESSVQSSLEYAFDTLLLGVEARRNNR